MKVRQILTLANEAGVAPDWINVGIKCVRHVVNRGQAYSDEISAQGLRKNSQWSVEPQSRDVTRMLFDLIQITKNIDNEEHLYEAESDKKKASTLSTDVGTKGDDKGLSDKVRKKLKDAKNEA